MKKLNYVLDKSLKTPLYIQLYQQIRQNIYQQKLQFGEKLPSKRQLCDYLQLSQNTVESAYAQLLAEGYIEAKARQGFFVSFQVELGFNLSKLPQKAPHFSTKTSIKYDLNPNKIDTQHFPLQIWRKCGRNCFGNQGKNLLNLGDKQGDMQLRLEIVEYLQASRGVQCQADQIIIGAGVESCLQQLILLFNQQYPQQSFSYAMENYGYHNVEKLLKLYGKSVLKLPINQQSQGIDLKLLAQHQINVAYLTPSHLYPFGQVLSISQRQQILEWANEKAERYIIEDDYDSEFRYKGKPIPALQSLDFKEKVIYLGSFSKLITPALRISFMVLPKTLLHVYQQHCDFFHSSVSRFEQQRLAHFMQSGEFEKHIHRMRKIYRKKMELLCQLLTPYRTKIRYYGEHSGFYLLIELLQESLSLVELTELAKIQNVKVYPIEYEDKKLFSIGFGDLSESELASAITLLIKSWLIPMD